MAVGIEVAGSDRLPTRPRIGASWRHADYFGPVHFPDLGLPVGVLPQDVVDLRRGQTPVLVDHRRCRIVTGSVAPSFGSPIVVDANGVTGASDVFVWPDTVPAMVGGGEAKLGSWSITVVAVSTAGAPPALLFSLTVRVVF